MLNTSSTITMAYTLPSAAPRKVQVLSADALTNLFTPFIEYSLWERPFLDTIHIIDPENSALLTTRSLKHRCEGTIARQYTQNGNST